MGKFESPHLPMHLHTCAYLQIWRNFEVTPRHVPICVEMFIVASIAAAQLHVSSHVKVIEGKNGTTSWNLKLIDPRRMYYLLYYCSVLCKWEFFSQMLASCLPLSFHQKRGATERGWVQNRSFSFEWKALIWTGRHCKWCHYTHQKKWPHTKYRIPICTISPINTQPSLARKDESTIIDPINWGNILRRMECLSNENILMVSVTR